MRRGLVAGLAGLVVLFILVSSTLFTVGQTQQALITQFGRPVRVIEHPGLHSKIPFAQTVIEFDRRLLYLGTRARR
jgi:membrane protease subunit HflC